MKKKALLNSVSSFALQMITIVCGFIIPRLVLNVYGSDVNGTISSISQFLSFITILEGGVGSVIRASLYKPLVEQDVLKISSVIKSADNIFRRISYLFLVFIVIVGLLYPYIVNQNVNGFFIFSMTIVIGMGIVGQYYFGLSHQILLQSDQKLYIISLLQIFAVVINTILISLLIHFNFPIFYVKLCSSLIFIIRPLILRLYVKEKYQLLKKVQLNMVVIKQQWDGIANHLAYFLHGSLDVLLLSIFTNLKEVSVYSIYFMVIIGTRDLTTTFSSSLEAAFGNIIARGDKEVLKRNFGIFELFSFMITTTIFSSTAILILPFVSIYTKGITDVSYFRPLFAYTFIAAEAFFCIRLPYHSIVVAAGHFKQTQIGGYLEALVNITISTILVIKWGLVGVALGTLASMIFRTILYAVYLSNNILNSNISIFIKKLLISMLSVLIILFVNIFINFGIIDSFMRWFIFAFITTINAGLITLGINYIFYKKEVKYLLEILVSIIYRRKTIKSTN